MLLVCRGDRWIFTTKDYEFLTIDFVQEEGIPYQYPRRLQIRAQAQGYLLDGEFVCTKLWWYTDVFDRLPELFRIVASWFLKRPVLFRFLGYFYGTLTGPDGSVRNLFLVGQSDYTVVQ